jgi:putative membrane protein
MELGRGAKPTLPPQVKTVIYAERTATGPVARQYGRLLNPWPKPARQAPCRHSTKKFANYEIAEQSTIAEILKSMGAVPPKMTHKQMTMIAKAKDGKAGAEFDKTYVADQIEGHKDLLKIQETYIDKGKDAGAVGLAKLARAQIKEHIDMLETIQKEMKS